METSKITYYPLKVLLGFLVFTEILFFLGPIDFNIPNPFGLITYLFILNSALWCGYRFGVRTFCPSNYEMRTEIINIIIIAGVVLEFLSLVSMWSQSGISISIDSLLESITNPGAAYYSDSNEEAETSIMGILLSPISFAAIPLAIATWRDRPRLIKMLIVLLVFITIAKWLGVGKRKGLLDIIAIVAFCEFACHPKLIENKVLHKKMVYVLIGFLVVFIAYFISSNLSRHGKDNLADAIISSSFYDCKDVYLEFLPPVFTLILMNVSDYLCQGYRALSLGLFYGILPLAPLGSSWFTIAIAKKIGYDPLPDTYMMLLEKDYDIGMTLNWHTAYLWFANDFTFIGVPFIVYFIGYFWAQSWCDSINGRNIVAFPVMCLFTIMVLYFFANNQVFSFSFFPFIVLFGFYMLTRIKSKIESE